MNTNNPHQGLTFTRQIQGILSLPLGGGLEGFRLEPEQSYHRMKYVLFVALALLLFCTYSISAQVVTIYDGKTRLPIPGVTIANHTFSEIIVTDSLGMADISPLKSTNKIHIYSFGYTKITTNYSKLRAVGFRLNIFPLAYDLSEIIISANRWRHLSRTTPAKIVKVLPSEVILQNPQTAADLLAISGNVFVQKSQQGGGSPMIRGFSTNRLLYAVDGVRMNTAIFRGGNIQNVINLDPFAIENTEVLLGTGSTYYGSDAIGGVMSFQTLKPKLSKNNHHYIKENITTRYSTANNEKTAHYHLNIGYKKWASITSFSNWNFGNLRQGSKGPNDYLKPYYVERQNVHDIIINQQDSLLQIPSAYKQTNLMQKLLYKPNENWELQYGFHYSGTSPYGRYDRHNRIKNNLPWYAKWNYGPQKWMMNHFNINHSKNNIFYNELKLSIAQQAFDESRISRSLNETDKKTQKEHVDAYSANIDFIKQISSYCIVYGAEYIQNKVASTGLITDIETDKQREDASRYPQSTWQSLGIYIGNEMELINHFTLQSGMRYNQYILDADFTNNLVFYPLPFNKTHLSKGALTGNIGGVYIPNNNWILKGGFNTAFRSPNVDDIGKIFDSEPGVVTIPNPNLKAEYAYNVDLGITHIFANTIKIEATAYYTILKNALVRRTYHLNGQDSIMYDGTLSQVQALQNAARANVYGFHTAFEMKLYESLSISSDLNYQEGKEELDNGTISPSRHAAPLFGTTRFNYYSGNFKLQFYANYQAQRKAADMPEEEKGKDEIYAKDVHGNNFAPAWLTLNLKSEYAINKAFCICAGIENLTDKRYRPYSSGISGAGRNFVLSLKIDF